MNRGLAFGTAILLIINVSSCRKAPDPPSPDDTALFEACVVPGTSSSLDIVTFNVEGFPKAGYSSVTALAALLKTIDADAVALQEVASEADFIRMANLMPGWTGYFYPIDNDDWNLAYLFKDSEIEVSLESARLLFKDDFYAFPRPPFEIMISHKPSGTDLYLINLHLKCCGGTDNENSRRTASQKLKEYLDSQRGDDAVVMLGDYNDEIASVNESENPFLNFVNDPDDYLFSDLAIAKGTPLWWSYPSWPSHLDHILVTDELAQYVDTTMVVKASPCYPDYADVLSDHRPVMVSILQ